MPPKRKGAARSTRVKKVKVEDAADSGEKKKIEALKNATEVKSKAKIDSCCTLDDCNSEVSWDILEISRNFCRLGIVKLLHSFIHLKDLFFENDYSFHLFIHPPRLCFIPAGC